MNLEFTVKFPGVKSLPFYLFLVTRLNGDSLSHTFNQVNQFVFNKEHG